jgi:hypothetical protein
MAIEWKELEEQALYAPKVGAVRGPISYRPEGWYFLPAWLPDETKNDIGQFKTRKAAVTEAERLYRAQAEKSTDEEKSA